MVVSLTRETIAAVGFIYLLRPRCHRKSFRTASRFPMPTTHEQADFAHAKSFVLCSFQPTKSACSAAAEKCLSGVGQPLSSVSGRKRYNTLDFASKIVCQQGCSRPYWKPRAKGFHPFGYPHHFLTNGTHIEKTAFYHVGPFLENATAHDIHFCRGFAKISTCAVGCRAKIPCLPTQKISSSRCCGRKTIADFLLIVPGLLSQKYFSKNSNKSVVNSV